MPTIALAAYLYVVPAFLPLYRKATRFFFAFGGRGGAKSIAVADYIVFECARRKIRVLCTREVQKSIKESVHALIKARVSVQNRDREFKITDNSIIHRKTKSEIIFAGLKDHTADSIKSYDSIDICWVEEAHSVTKKSWDILIPTIRNNDSRIIFTYNRFMENDPCHQLGMRETEKQVKLKYSEGDKNWTWKTFEGRRAYGVFINGEEGNPKFPDVLKEEAEACLANDPEVYPHVWLGEPIGEAEFSCIPRDAINDAMSRKIPLPPKETPYTCGVDVARFGADSTVFYLRQGNKFRYLKRYKKKDTQQTSDLLEKMCEKFKIPKYRIKFNIDDTGVGGGVTDAMKRRGWTVVPINFGNAAKEKRKYNNTISEMWFYLKEVLPQVDLPDDERLRTELAGRLWKMDNKERRCIESKDDFKKRYGRSPDFADACVLAYFDKKKSLSNIKNVATLLKGYA